MPLLNTEPMLLVGRPGEPERETVSLYERIVEVFADPPESGMYNAHGDYMTAFEQRSRLDMHWLGNPGTFDNCLATVTRAVEPAFVLDFESYATRYADAGLPIHTPAEIQPYWPWSIAWRDEQTSRAVADLLRVALETAEQNGWNQPIPHPETESTWTPDYESAFITSSDSTSRTSRPPVRDRTASTRT